MHSALELYRSAECLMGFRFDRPLAIKPDSRQHWSEARQRGQLEPLQMGDDDLEF